MDNAASKKKFIEFIKSKKLLLTDQRKAIIEAAFSTKEHFTAEDLISRSRKRDASVSRATVYRTLALLTESGLMRAMDFGRDQTYYDPNYRNHPNHSHIVCVDCNRIVEYDSKKVEELEREVASMGYEIESSLVQIYARCKHGKNASCCKKHEHHEHGSQPHAT